MAKRGRGSTLYRELGEEAGWAEAQLKAVPTKAGWFAKSEAAKHLLYRFKRLKLIKEDAN